MRVIGCYHQPEGLAVHGWMSWLAIALLLISLNLLGIPRAQGQDAGVCPEEVVDRGPVDVRPAAGAGAVSLNAPLWLRYSPDYWSALDSDSDFASEVELYRCRGEGCGLIECDGADGERVSGSFRRYGDELLFYPAGGLQATTSYVGIARGQDRDLSFHFCTGTEDDTEAPRLGGINEVRTSRVEPSCESPSGGYRVEVDFNAAVDWDGPPGSIEYLLYLSNASGLEAPRLMSRVRNYAPGDVTMAFVLEPERTRASVCVMLQAVDGVGHLSADVATGCFDPYQGSAFAPLCSFRSAGETGTRSAWGCALCVIVALTRQARRPRPS